MIRKIGIAGNERTAVNPEDQNEYTFSYTPKEFVEGVTKAGGLPVILPLGQPEQAKDYIDLIDVLLLAGGQDVDPSLYDQDPHEKLGDLFKQRDTFELALIQEAIRQKKPIAGVCRGMQLLNVAFGGTMIQDLSLDPSLTLAHVQSPVPLTKATHEITIEPNSYLAEFLPETVAVNSYHHQAVDQIAPPFTVTARATDGAVEAIEGVIDSSCILGVQWHPEQGFKTNPTDQEFFTYLVERFN